MTEAPKRKRARPPAAPLERRAHHRATRLDERELDLLQRLSALLEAGESEVLRAGLMALAELHGIPT